MRLEGWEGRLAVALADAEVCPYVLGTHDCLRVACAAVEALTGRDFWPQFAGYHTKRQALAVIARFGRTLGDAVGNVLGVPSSTPLEARRGDLVLYHDREHHLGVCTGPRVVVTHEAGLLHIPLDNAGVLNCWRVG